MAIVVLLDGARCPVKCSLRLPKTGRVSDFVRVRERDCIFEEKYLGEQSYLDLPCRLTLRDKAVIRGQAGVSMRERRVVARKVGWGGGGFAKEDYLCVVIKLMY